MLLLYIMNRTHVLFVGVVLNSWYFKPIFALPRDIWTVKMRIEWQKILSMNKEIKTVYSVQGCTLYCTRAGMRSPIYAVYDVLLTCSLYLSYAIYVFVLK